MSKILLNPQSGSPISDVQINGSIYFKDKPFDVDTIIKFSDDAVGEDLLKRYEFLVEMTGEEAKNYREDQAKRTFVCEKCENWKTTTQLALTKHLEKHAREEQLEKDLGIEVVTGIPVKPRFVGQAAIDQQALSDGLDYGEGLVEDSSRIGARF